MRRPAMVTVAVLLLAAALAACRDSTLTLEVPQETTRASVTATGIVTGGSAVTVTVAGGAVSVDAVTDDDGTFSVEVPLRPGELNQLTATAGEPATTSTASVTQIHQDTGAQLHGRVVRPQSAAPVAGAVVSYGSTSTTTDDDGTFELGPLPDGTVVATSNLDGSIPANVLVEVADGVAPDTVVPLQERADAVTVDEKGREFSGPGWTLTIPPGALSSPTQVQVTGLLFGREPAPGLPLVEIAPPDLQLNVPAKVTIDLAAIGFDPAPADVTAVDSAALTTQTLSTAPEGGLLKLTLSGTKWGELWVKARDLLTGQRCTPYDSLAKAIAVETYMRQVLLPFLAVKVGADATAAFDVYLTPGRATADRHEYTNELTRREFANDPQTVAAVDNVWADALAAVHAQPPELTAPEQPVSVELASMPSQSRPGQPVGELIEIDYDFLRWEHPGVIAGGTGGVHIEDLNRSVADERRVTGKLSLVPAASETGVLQDVTAIKDGDWKLQVFDSIDFCPGAPGGSIARIFATVPMSRLEMTVFPAARMAVPQLFEVNTEVTPSDVLADVTDAYPDNDSDDDTIPHAQPWNGATFRLDNCPDVANTDQADQDSDGVGDACDTPPESEFTVMVVTFQGTLDGSRAHQCHSGLPPNPEPPSTDGSSYSSRCEVTGTEFDQATFVMDDPTDTWLDSEPGGTWSHSYAFESESVSQNPHMCGPGPGTPGTRRVLYRQTEPFQQFTTTVGSVLEITRLPDGYMKVDIVLLGPGGFHPGGYGTEISGVIHTEVEETCPEFGPPHISDGPYMGNARLGDSRPPGAGEFLVPPEGGTFTSTFKGKDMDGVYTLKVIPGTGSATQ